MKDRSSPIIWKPTGAYLERSNVRRFMDRHKIESYEELIRRSTEDIEWFWSAALEDLGLEWFEPYETLLDLSDGFPWARWFVGGRLNIVHNCIDRHIRDGGGDREFLLWEGDGGEARKLTYAEADGQIRRVAGALRSFGIQEGDAVGLYMPMVPEVVIAFFACLKIGAVAVPVFSGYGEEALATRLNDAKARVLFTTDGAVRRGKNLDVKGRADRALERAPTVETVIVYRRTGEDVPWKDGRDHDWAEIVRGATPIAETASLEAEARSLIIYTSGTTGPPKGTVHTHAGCLAQMMKELAYYMDIRPGDRFFWLSDIGWMMGPWELIGVSALGGTFLIYEGLPNHPDPGRLWRIVEKYRLTHLGISPTAIRMLMRSPSSWVEEPDLSSLRILASTGETWDPDSYHWFFERVGKKRCPIINISGGTEIVGCLLSPLPITELKACTLRGPGLGMDVDVFDEDGKPIREGIGHLVCKKPAPSMTKGFLGDPERYIETYFSRGKDIWYHGDWARVDADGFYFLHGRADDTIKVAGKRVGPGEIESALLDHAAVSEAAVVGVPDDIKGQVIVAFVVSGEGVKESDDLREELKSHVAEKLGGTLRPSDVRFVDGLPKTRSAKIVRGVIRKRFLGEEVGDVASVENPEAIDAIGRSR
ncbi:MAG: AMP-binding protein [Planctomycetota bacterium]|nr:AMP-binding protein [Planctomycetota bacterium]